MNEQERIDKLIEKGKEVLRTHRPNASNMIGFTTLDSGKFIAWKTQVLSFFNEILPPDSPYIETFKSNVKQAYKSSAQEGIGILESVKEDLTFGLLNNQIEPKFDPTIPLFNLFDKFHQIVRQLRYRYDSRETLNVTDEYDMQNLLHSLLHLYFDDIRPEEWTPSYAGKSSRMDFLLKDYKIIIEVKKTRKGLTEKELGSQLIDDIARYKSHPDCETLLCFTYDPEGLIGNPRGLENDLNRQEENGLNVKVIIRP
jgi:hypothetical protein